MTKVDTPEAGSIEQVSKLLKCEPSQMIKTLIYMADGQPLAVLLRGDREANENKIRRAVGASKLELAPPEVIQQVTGAAVGFAGPVGLSIPLWADDDVASMRNVITGANETDAHYTGVNLGRDFTVEDDHFADLRNAVNGDPAPGGQGTLALRQAIEVGHVFKLGTKYSEALGARFLDDNEQQHDIIMGCYGIGVNRIIAALIETRHDEQGIVWPLSLAPYQVLLAPLNVTQEDVMRVAHDLHDALEAAGVETLMDDRDQRPGVKFKDADLIGIPLRVVIGGRGLKDGQLEVKWRTDSEPTMIPLEGAAKKIAEMVKQRASA